MDEHEAVNRAIAEHLDRLRQRLLEGRSEIARQRASIDATHEHMAGMSRWIEETERQLREERLRRDGDGGS